MKTLILIPVLFCAMAHAVAAGNNATPAKDDVFSNSVAFLGREVALPAGQWKVAMVQGSNTNSNLGPNGEARTIVLATAKKTDSPVNNLVLTIQTASGIDRWNTPCDSQRDKGYGYHEYSGGGFDYPRCSFLSTTKIKNTNFLTGTISFTSSDSAITVQTLVKVELFGQTLPAQLDASQVDTKQKAFYDAINNWLIQYGNEVMNCLTSKQYHNIELLSLGRTAAKP